MAAAWDAYVDAYVGPKTMQSGAIFGVDGGVWANPSNLEYDQGKLVEILTTGFAKKDSPIAGTTITFNKKKYLILNADEEFIHGKGLGVPGGIMLYKTTMGACLVGIYTEDPNAVDGREAMYKMVKHLNNSPA
ncbi:hypothetical protein GGI25_004875 [Coemansia spiralis]|uniref:Profilin n=2 Tax=Coemansia TaxID=4863 RepID=A0A9W8G4U9_9FUNG|nr:profilin [Coemansia spiralis]KAJ1991944.1 hypothetical protein EDC05_003098 [Coemansia umbellata]KAJ2625315.1 hypothetical protein GGI26_000785 [Coemansia sp. RSA 1358]KAJ2673060.1 hypothetical protein GGI25_004875 [Coemansia spiralis]